MRTLFLALAATATPATVVLVGCGGTVIERSAGSGGQPGGGGPVVFTGVAEAGPFVGRRPSDPSEVPPMYVGSGGAYMGTGGPPSGGVPIYYGSGGAIGYGGSGGAIGYGGSGGVIFDAGEPDSAPTEPPPGDAGSCDAGGDGRVGPSGCGRRPPGLEDAPHGAGADIRGYFQEMARLEAASVPAFRRLGRELSLFRAPRRLLDAARRAARDEVNHTRLGRTLAERFGGKYVPPRIGPWRLRTLEALAIDNATEGGVRETFGALVATWQSRAAADPVVRRVMRRVAIDETRHASLAIRVATWADKKLSAEARARVREARRDAAARVLRELDWEPSADLVTIAGVPRRADARRLAGALTERLWA